MNRDHADLTMALAGVAMLARGFAPSRTKRLDVHGPNADERVAKAEAKRARRQERNLRHQRRSS